MWKDLIFIATASNPTSPLGLGGLGLESFQHPNWEGFTPPPTPSPGVWTRGVAGRNRILLRLLSHFYVILFWAFFWMPSGDPFFGTWRPTWPRKPSILRAQAPEIRESSRRLLGYPRHVQKVHPSHTKTTFLHIFAIRKITQNRFKSHPKRFKNRLPLGNAFGTPKINIFMLKT